MKVDVNIVRAGMQEGVAAIQREIEAYGTESDKARGTGAPKDPPNRI